MQLKMKGEFVLVTESNLQLACSYTVFTLTSPTSVFCLGPSTACLLHHCLHSCWERYFYMHAYNVQNSGTLVMAIEIVEKKIPHRKRNKESCIHKKLSDS